MKFDFTRSPERGLFLAHSGILQVHFASSDVDAVFHAGNQEIELAHLGTRQVSCDSIPFDSISKRQADALLTLIHEREHYARFFSTPFGLLVWRCLNVLTLGVRGTVLEISKFGSPDFQGKRLTEWFDATGNEWLAEQLQSSPEIAHLVLEPRSVSFDRYFSALSAVNEGLKSVSAFLGDLLGDTRLTLGELTNLANRAFDHLAFESGLQNLVRWETRHPALPALPPYNTMFTVRDLLEASARMKEFEIINVSGHRVPFGESWKNSTLTGKQAEAFDWVLKVTREPVLARVVFDVAFSSKIDLACFAGPQPVRFYLEDVHPSWRFYRLIGLLCDERVLNRETRRALFARGIDAFTEIGPEQVLGMPGVKSSVECAKTHPILGPRARVTWVQQLGFQDGRDGPEIPIPPEMQMGWSTLHFLDSQVNAFHRAFAERHANSIVNQEALFPDLEFYSDTVRLNHYSPGQGHLWKYLQNVRMLIVHMGGMALLEGGEMPSFRPMIAAIKRRLKREGMDESTPAYKMLIKAFLSPKTVLQQTLGENVYQNLQTSRSQRSE